MTTSVFRVVQLGIPGIKQMFSDNFKFFSFFGDNYLNNSVMGNVTFGSTTQEYPNIDLNDPIPAYNRGYYFTISF
jgi:hypothetical protein